MPKQSSSSVRVLYALPKERVHAVARKYVERLKKQFKLRLVVLFGSYAKDTYSYGSDLDILVVADDLPSNYGRRFVALKDTDFDVEIQPFGYTTGEFTKMRKARNRFLEEVLTEGKVLFSKLRDSSL